VSGRVRGLDLDRLTKGLIMYPYNVKFRNPKGFLVFMPCSSVLEGQQIALRHGAVCYTITDRGGIEQYKVETSIKNLRGIA